MRSGLRLVGNDFSDRGADIADDKVWPRDEITTQTLDELRIASGNEDQSDVDAIRLDPAVELVTFGIRAAEKSPVEISCKDEFFSIHTVVGVLAGTPSHLSFAKTPIVASWKTLSLAHQFCKSLGTV